MRFTNIIVSLAALSGLTSAAEHMEPAKMKQVILRTKPDGYAELNEELRGWLESGLEKDTQYTKRIEK